MVKEEVLIIADNRFPDTYAATTRMYMLCKLFQAAGYETTVYIINVDKNRRIYLRDQKITCRWFDEGNSALAYYYIHNKYFMRAISKRKNLRYVVIYQEVLLKMLPVILKQKKLQCQVIGYFDEWYDWGKMYSSTRWREFHRDITVRAAEYVVAPMLRKRIVISRWLDQFYGRKHNFYFPAVVDLKEDIWEGRKSANQERIMLLYAGFPGNRDDLRNLVEVIDELSENKKRKIMFKIYTYATTLEDLKRHIPNLTAIRRRNEGIIQFCGEADRTEIISQLKKVDFSCLIRKNKRSNNAGFSTKISESMAVGIPMLITDTSDAAVYIRDGVNGILLQDDSKEQVRKGIERILLLRRSDIEKMKRNARRTAEEWLDYTCYSKEIREFLEQ
ncbi:MAG: glycosyltransferase [Lachnospiraceae bacterium]